MCVIAYKASTRRARHFMREVPWPDSRVQIRQTSKQVVVQRCGLTSDRKPAPRPPAHHPSQSQYMWSLKKDAPGIRLQERSTICDAQHARAFALWRAFFGALLRRAAPENRSFEDKKHGKYTRAFFQRTKTRWRGPANQTHSSAMVRHVSGAKN